VRADGAALSRYTPAMVPATPAPLPVKDDSAPTGALAAWRAMLPYLVATWLLATLLPGPRGYQVMLIIATSPFFLAAEARAAGAFPGWSTPVLALQRAVPHLANLLVLLLFAAFGFALGATLGAMAADALGLTGDRLLALPLGALVALPVLWWHWPAAALAYAPRPGEATRDLAAGLTPAPRYGHARTLIRAAGSPRTAALILAFATLWVALLATAGADRAPDPLPLVADAMTYLAFLPLLVWMMATETRRMLRALEIRVDLLGGDR
jgi:hypothetical protein